MIPDRDASATHPARIGPFRIVGRIGEGAMGIVYEAVQDRPQRRVALKVVRPGMVPAGVLRRFELESELLGRLQHPGIAQIYQAGVEHTEYGPQPYFAMELVRGERLDEYIRTKVPGLRERLALVAAIADAVQHAHHRGIIHRDLKPANILVTESGEPKVLDFGIARAAPDAALTGLQTVAGEVLGTLSYMSPEQISGDVSALDTRSDVYALGVILYEVLAGRAPYELERKSLAEAARIIQDVEPTRLRFATRAIAPDVETIVAKALEKEKERRYSSAAELADDIRRFLRDEPIAARPPSAVYQIRKFARRHKAIVGGALIAVAALVAGVVAASWQAVRASRAERVAEQRAREAEIEAAKAEAVTSFLTRMLESVDPSRARGQDPTVREALDAAAARIDAGAMASRPEVESAVRNVIGTTYGSLGLFDAAERQLRRAMALQERTRAGALERAATLVRLVNVLYPAGKYAEAIAVAEEALRLRRGVLGDAHADVATSLDDLGAVLIAQGDSARAEQLMREALAIRRRVLPATDPQLAVNLNNLAYVNWRKGNLQEAESLYREALDIDRRTLGNEHPEVPTKLINLVVVLSDQGRPEVAEPLAREAVAIRRRILGPEHPALPNALDALAGTLDDQGKTAEAETLLREALVLARKSFGDVHRETARQELHLGWLLWAKGAYAEALPLLRAASINIPKAYGATHRLTRAALASLAHGLNAVGQARAAETTARAALAVSPNAPADVQAVSAMVALSHALIAQQRHDAAVPHLRQALDAEAKQTVVRLPWLKGEIESTLGSALPAQESVAAERLLLAGYRNLRRHPSAPIPSLRAAAERLIAFYTANGRPADAEEWRRRLQEHEAALRAAR